MQISDHGGVFGGRSPNLKPENIKEGVNISGVLGEYSKRPKMYRGGSGKNYPPHFTTLPNTRASLSKDGNYLYYWNDNTSTKRITRDRYDLNMTLLDSSLVINLSNYTSILSRVYTADGSIAVICNLNGVYSIRRYDENGNFLGSSALSSSYVNAVSQNLSVNSLGDYAFANPNTNAWYYIFNSLGTQLFFMTQPNTLFTEHVYWLSDRHVAFIHPTNTNAVSFVSYNALNQWAASWQSQTHMDLGLALLKLMLSNYGKLLN
ncbi:hypothetical protein OE059_04840 [Exiguobacterium profundum]|uniref:Uncharacterized protein n=1 Tax=Exiguobacterium profundum TaxID=307643 RepID=A0ABY8B513_9BACL|nr:hypothetical protein [Exiguobacterium profundum]WED56188.1 hypothetical protein OE059_04840 [Exiguobacterium profundum]